MPASVLVCVPVSVLASMPVSARERQGCRGWGGNVLIFERGQAQGLVSILLGIRQGAGGIGSVRAELGPSYAEQ
eukprot:12765684-Alexandrium_andersonii.AAC.1